MGFEVTPVTSRSQFREFLRFPEIHYRADPYFVPHLRAERKEFFSPKNPIFDFIEVQYFLAHDERGETVGRISAHINRRHNEYAGERTGFFGFFESVNDPGAAGALFGAAEAWLAGKGMTTVRGPLNFSTNEECGLLIEGSDRPPVIMMTYNPEYYAALLTQLGYSKARDLFAYEYRFSGGLPDYLVRFGEKVRRRFGVVVRRMDGDNFEEDVEKAFSIYNRAWSQNWGFVPMSKEQFAYTARNLKPILDPSLALIAEIDSEPVAFLLALPDYNPLFQRMKGRLFPFGIFHFLLGRRRIRGIRVLTMGVVREHRRRGIDVLLAYEAFRNGLPRGYVRAECSWVLESNMAVRRAIERIGMVHYKTYRIYEKCL